MAIQFLEVIEKPLYKNPKLTGQLIGTIFDQLWNARGDVANALGNDQTKLTELPTGLVCLRRASSKKSLPYPMQREERLLLDIFDRNKAHVRSIYRLADGLGIGCIVFVGLDIGLDKLRCHQSHGVAHALQLASPVMSTATASIPIRHGGRFTKNVAIWSRLSCFFSTALPRSSIS